MFPPFFNLLLVEAKNELLLAKEAADAQGLSRAMLCTAAALQLSELFRNHEQMKSFRLTLLVSSEDTLEGGDRVFKRRQHLKIAAPGCPVLQTSDDKASFFITCLPTWLLGDGSFGIGRDHPKLQSLMTSDRGRDDERVRAYDLALDIDRCFQLVRQGCYLGEII